MRRVAVIAALVLFLTLLAAGPAVARSHIGGEDNEATYFDQKRIGGEVNSPSTDPVLQIPKPYLIYTYTPACGANHLPTGDDPKEKSESFALCLGATNPCPNKRYLLYRVATMQMTAEGKSDGDWEAAGTTFRGADDPPEGGPVQITQEMIFDAAKKKAATPVVHVEPKTKSFVNIPNNFYTDTDASTATVHVLGQAIDITFTPRDISWSFGDDSKGTGAGIAHAKVGANGAVEHDYRRSGDYDITVERTYKVTFTLPGGKTATLDTLLSNTSEPYALKIGEIQSVVTAIS